MRQLIVASAIVLLSTSAFAGGSRSLSSSSAPLTSPQPQVTAPQPQIASSQPQIVAPPPPPIVAPPPIVEPPKPIRRAEVTVLPAPVEQPAVTTTTEPPRSMEDKLKAAGELKQDGSSTRQVESTVQTQPAPAQTQVRSASVTTHATAPSAAQPTVHAQRPVRQRVARRRESTEHKVRRIAARFGIYF